MQPGKMRSLNGSRYCAFKRMKTGVVLIFERASIRPPQKTAGGNRPYVLEFRHTFIGVTPIEKRLRPVGLLRESGRRTFELH